MKVFIIDDSNTVVMSTTMAFTDAGHEVGSHRSPFGATSAARQFKPDVILLDVNMPGLNGASLLPILRKHTDAMIIYHTTEDLVPDDADGIIHKSPRVVELTEAAHKGFTKRLDSITRL